MEKSAFITAVAATLLLSGCADVGQTASYGEFVQDKLILTTAQDVPAAEMKCVALSQSLIFKSGSVTFTLPAGKYKGERKHKSGVFYYAPSAISATYRFNGRPDGIYIDNGFTTGNLFTVDYMSITNAPIRNVILPSSVLSRFSRSKC